MTTSNEQSSHRISQINCVAFALPFNHNDCSLRIIIITILLNYRFDFLQISIKDAKSRRLFALCVKFVVFGRLWCVDRLRIENHHYSSFTSLLWAWIVSTGKDKQLKSDAQPLTININELHRMVASISFDMFLIQFGKPLQLLKMRHCLLNTVP